MEEQKARRIAEDILEGHPDLFIVDLKLKGAVGNRKLLIFIDGDEGMSIDRCGSVSRAIAGRLEEEDIIEGKYVLEVSSPGLDFPLTFERQYQKNVGRALIVKLKEGQKIEGVLLKVDEDGLLLDQANQSKKVSWNEIEETKIKISFK